MNRRSLLSLLLTPFAGYLVPPQVTYIEFNGVNLDASGWPEQNVIVNCRCYGNRGQYGIYVEPSSQNNRIYR